MDAIYDEPRDALCLDYVWAEQIKEENYFCHEKYSSLIVKVSALWGKKGRNFYDFVLVQVGLNFEHLSFEAVSLIKVQ